MLYGPFDAKVFGKKYRGEAVYNQEDDVHHPTLTVGQTLGFALDTKTPGKRPGGITKKEFKSKVINLLLKMFNIEHTLNTVVGNPVVRGISGGEYVVLRPDGNVLADNPQAKTSFHCRNDDNWGNSL